MSKRGDGDPIRICSIEQLRHPCSLLIALGKLILSMMSRMIYGAGAVHVGRCKLNEPLSLLGSDIFMDARSGGFTAMHGIADKKKNKRKDRLGTSREEVCLSTRCAMVIRVIADGLFYTSINSRLRVRTFLREYSLGIRDRLHAHVCMYAGWLLACSLARLIAKFPNEKSRDTTHQI